MIEETFKRVSRKWITTATADELRSAWMAEPFVPKQVLVAAATSCAFADGVERRVFDRRELGLLSQAFHGLLDEVMPSGLGK